MPNANIADGLGPGIEEEVLCNFPDVGGLRESCELAELSKERCRFSVVIPPSMADYRGAVHGGATYLVSEVACGIATYVLGRANVCMQASIDFLKAVPAGMSTWSPKRAMPTARARSSARRYPTRKATRRSRRAPTPCS